MTVIAPSSDGAGEPSGREAETEGKRKEEEREREEKKFEPGPVAKLVGGGDVATDEKKKEKNDKSPPA
jgi:hypothetical protein